MENISILFVSVTFCLLTSLSIWLWLRSSLRDLLSQLCAQGGNTEFWARYTLLMLMIAPLAIVVMFLPSETQSFNSAMRELLLMTLLSHFLSFTLVGRSLYKAVQRQIQKNDLTPWQAKPPYAEYSQAK